MNVPRHILVEVLSRIPTWKSLLPRRNKRPTRPYITEGGTRTLAEADAFFIDPKDSVNGYIGGILLIDTFTRDCILVQLLCA